MLIYVFIYIFLIKCYGFYINYKIKRISFKLYTANVGYKYRNMPPRLLRLGKLRCEKYEKKRKELLSRGILRPWYSSRKDQYWFLRRNYARGHMNRDVNWHNPFFKLPWSNSPYAVITKTKNIKYTVDSPYEADSHSSKSRRRRINGIPLKRKLRYKTRLERKIMNNIKVKNIIYNKKIMNDEKNKKNNKIIKQGIIICNYCLKRYITYNNKNIYLN
eukprot:GHVL01022097.1.p1 GENE.GHVL01022097.1~~GHVL01022097.1.p1  ORF type:complete len:217 (+),score=54.57 GHVL01022097.1:131-781(+)